MNSCKDVSRRKNEAEIQVLEKAALKPPQSTKHAKKVAEQRPSTASSKSSKEELLTVPTAAHIPEVLHPKDLKPEPKRVKVTLATMKRSESVHSRGTKSRRNPSPLISPSACKVHREGDISDRLLRYKVIYDEKRKELQMQKDKDVSVIQLTFKPTLVSSRARTPSPHRSKSPTREESQMEFKPQLSKMSLRLAARLGNSTDRLRTPTPRRQPMELDENCTFSPAVNPNSVRLDNRRKVDDDGSKMKRWEGLYDMVQVFKAKREELTRKYSRQEAEEEAACTFHPAISSPSTGTGVKELPDRLTGWAKEKEERLQQQRDEELMKETEGCTFTPEVHVLREEGCSPLRTRKGMEKFLERQEIARKQKASKAKMMDKYMGNKWTPKLTTPKSPKFRSRAETPNRKQRVHYLDLNV